MTISIERRDRFATEEKPLPGDVNRTGPDDTEPPLCLSAPPDPFDRQDQAHDDLGPSHGVAIGVFLSIPIWILVVALLLLALR
jgi:hypothetical protein